MVKDVSMDAMMESLDTLRELASSLQWQDSKSQTRHNKNSNNNNTKSVNRRLSFKEPTTSSKQESSSTTGRRQSHPDDLVGASSRRRKSSTSFQDVIAQVGILDPLPRKWSTGIVEDLTGNTRNATAAPLYQLPTKYQTQPPPTVQAPPPPAAAVKRPSFINLTENRHNYYNSLPSPRLKEGRTPVSSNSNIGALYYSRHHATDETFRVQQQPRSKSLVPSQSHDSGHVSLVDQITCYPDKKFFNIADVSPEHSPLPLIKSCSDLYNVYHQRALSASMTSQTNHQRSQSYMVQHNEEMMKLPSANHHHVRQNSSVQTDPLLFVSPQHQ